MALNGFVSTDEDPVSNNMLEVNEGTYTVIVTDTPTGCTSSCSVSVTVNPNPSCSIASCIPICEGGTLNLNLTTDIGDTYSWSGPNGFVSTDEDPVIIIC